MIIQFLILFIFILVMYLYVINKPIKENFSSSLKLTDTFIRRKAHEFRKILIKTKEVLDSLEIPFFLSSGTLLGYYRENKFLDHDYDVDIGIFAKDYTPEIKTRMQDAGFDNYRNLGNPSDGYEMSFYLKDSHLKKIAKIDIFLHYKETVDNEDYMYWTSYEIPELKKKIKYRVPYFTIKEDTFYNVKVNVPEDTLKYIVNHYGEDWKTPKYLGVSYDYRVSPASIVKSDSCGGKTR